MKKTPTPTFEQFLDAHWAIDQGINDLRKERDTIRRIWCNQTYSAKTPLGLLDFGPSEEERQAGEASLALELESAERIAHDKFKTLYAVTWLTAREGFMQFSNSLDLIQRSRPSSRLAAPDARWLLIGALLLHVGHVHRNTLDQRTPRQMKKSDWRDAQKAIDELNRLEKERGLPLRELIVGRRYLPYFPIGWHKEATDRIHFWLSTTSSYANENTLYRGACKDFTRVLLITFGEAPPALVKGFGALIDYESKSLDKLIPKWVEEHEQLPGQQDLWVQSQHLRS